jgi:hypothetical protein
VVALITTVARIAGMNALHVMNVTETIVIIETIVHPTAGNALDLPLLVVPTMTTVAPGLRPPGGRLMTEGLQGTMITDAGVMMTAERHLIIMTDAGTILIDAETTEDAMTRIMKIGLQGTRTEMAGGLVDFDPHFFWTLAKAEKRMAFVKWYFRFYVGLRLLEMALLVYDRSVNLWPNTRWSINYNGVRMRIVTY